MSQGISARSIQPVEPASSGDLRRFIAATQPAPRAADPGPAIYKPWV
jgi:hypothetical protein